eukprot:scpid80178/ scgid10431/ 
MTRVLKLPSTVRSSRPIQCAMQLTRALLDGNFVRFVRVARLATPLMLCALHPALLLVRRVALQTMNSAYACRNAKFPAKVVGDWLAADSQRQVEEWCRSLGLEVANGDVVFSKTAVAQRSSVLSQKADILITSSLPPNVLDLLLPSCCC